MMMSSHLRPDHGPPASVLLVEGEDDFNFFGHFRNLHGLDDVFKVLKGGGAQNILSGLKVRLEAKNENYLGIVLDADEDIEARWNSLRDKLNAFGYENIPKKPDVAGTILIQEGLTTIGIWLMPDNSAEGSIEHFVSTILRPDDNLWQRAINVVEDIPPEEQLFGTTQAAVMKAKVHTWLAWQEEPGTPLGQALRKTYLDKDAPPALLLADWLRKLFNS